MRLLYTMCEQADIKMQFAAMSTFSNAIITTDFHLDYDLFYFFVNQKYFHTIKVHTLCDMQITR